MVYTKKECGGDGGGGEPESRMNGTSYTSRVVARSTNRCQRHGNQTAFQPRPYEIFPFDLKKNKGLDGRSWIFELIALRDVGRH